MALCAVGGVIGVLVGAIITYIVDLLPIGPPATLSPVWVTIGFTVSCTIGLVFGIYPALEGLHPRPNPSPAIRVRQPAASGEPAVLPTGKIRFKPSAAAVHH